MRTKEGKYSNCAHTPRTIKYPEKVKANNACCVLKKDAGFEYHHWSYNEEHFKDVIKLSRKGHKTAHMYMRYDEASKKYRSESGVLLETREQHANYLKWLKELMPKRMGKLPELDYAIN